jgi:3-phosphoshikimate 1-carboxyvinyltransferase
MTLALLNDLDIKTSFEGNVIKVYQKKCKQKK